jgi:hypothetical protein
MPVVYMTGTQGEDWASKGVPNSVLLAKPFAPAQLVTAIQSAQYGKPANRANGIEPQATHTVSSLRSEPIALGSLGDILPDGFPQSHSMNAAPARPPCWGRFV